MEQVIFTLYPLFLPLDKMGITIYILLGFTNNEDQVHKSAVLHLNFPP